jgi:hypothetical protein
MGGETEKVRGLYPRPLPIFLNRDAAGAGLDAEADADTDGLGAGAEKREEDASAPLSAIKGAPAQAEKAALKNDGAAGIAELPDEALVTPGAPVSAAAGGEGE